MNEAAEKASTSRGSARYQEVAASPPRRAEVAPPESTASRERALGADAESHLVAGRPALALTLADAAIRLAPERAQGHAARARALRALGDAEGALAALDALIARDPGNALAHDARGVLLAEAGRIGQGRVAFEAALRLDPGLARAHFGLASLGPVAPAQRAAMEALASGCAALDGPQRLFLLYALAKAYDDSGDFARAFAAAEAGASLRRQRWRGDAESGLARLGEAAWPQAKATGGAPTEAPIFVFAMPRSGTTLVEQILASHAQVFALGETEFFAREAHSDPAQAAAAYLQHWPTRARAAPRVVDKSLGNFLHIGAIRRAFPNAKLVHVRRDAMDCGLSIHFSLFSGEMPFPPDLSAIGRYISGYEALMATWRAALPADVMHEVVYERLVADLEGETCRLLDFCGLPWDARCLAFHETTRPVTTASLAQVRRPIYDSAVGRARNYAPWLGALRAALDGEADPDRLAPLF